MSDDLQNIRLSNAVRAAFDPIVKALEKARADLAALPDICAIRPGYDDRPDPRPALVVAVTPGSKAPDAKALETRYAVPVRVVDATVEEQLAKDGAPASFGLPGGATASAFERLIAPTGLFDFAPPKTGAYQPPNPSRLTRVEARMRLTLCVSPEAGWMELEDFLAGTRKSLTVAMYQFTAPHIFNAVSAAVEGAGRQFELVLHPVPERPPASGVKAQDLDEEKEVLPPLAQAMSDRFQMAWATLVSIAHPDGLWASAYHIKVAVRDGEAVWLSSGNWQSSNQPEVRPFDAGAAPLPPNFQKKYNRDYHAVFESRELASIFEFYIKRDHDLCARQAEQPASFSQPDLFVPQEAEEPAEFAAPAQLFQPLQLDRVIGVQPILTPDNYAEHALKLIGSATQSLWFQNQYINFRGTDEDFPDFKRLVSAIKAQIDAGREVRIICRDLMKEESLDILIALGFPKAVFRFQPACHNKAIIVDRKRILFGSHNWSNEGVLSNRDASLLFDDAEIADYFAKVYDYDWERLATAHPTPTRPRVAKEGEATPAGFRRASFSEVFDD